MNPLNPPNLWHPLNPPNSLNLPNPENLSNLLNPPKTSHPLNTCSHLANPCFKDSRFHFASISFLIRFAVLSFSILLGFVDFVTYLMKLTLNFDLKLWFESLTICDICDIFVTFWRTPLKSCKKVFLQNALVLIGNFDNIFLYIRSPRHSW